MSKTTFEAKRDVIRQALDRQEIREALADPTTGAEPDEFTDTL